MSRRPVRRTIERDEPKPISRLVSGLVGGVLLGIAIVWIGYLLLQRTGLPLPKFPTLSGIISSNNAPITQIAPLTAEGITLGQSDQTPALNQQQALLLASQLEPYAATKAKTTGAKFVLLTYPNVATPATHASFNGTPVWMITYQQIPQQVSGGSVNAAPSAQTTYDLYVFLDASSGKEVLVVRV